MSSPLTRKKSVGKSPKLGTSRPIGKQATSPGPLGQTNDDPVRKRVKEMLANALYKESEGHVESLEKAMEIAVKLELEMYTVFHGTNQAYKDKFRTLNFNLKDEKNERLRSLVVSGAVGPERLITMSSQELANPERRESNTKIEKNNMREAQLYNPSKHAATTDLFKCGKCKQRKCTYYQLQVCVGEAIKTWSVVVQLFSSFVFFLRFYRLGLQMNLSLHLSRVWSVITDGSARGNVRG
uniref:TFIIS central domain-containing protein n=1 Tax=Rhodosorus marinus TaxID=101924 RepID=A0A7S2ZFE8_9RHOD|mmetsp:Transcript_17667/g.71345  ORF Transcript_17667/g.71345 Transcript_17667/m.71345 type:complete len:239 (+) Transcript_17667:202-918(+)